MGHQCLAGVQGKVLQVGGFPLRSADYYQDGGIPLRQVDAVTVLEQPVYVEVPGHLETVRQGLHGLDAVQRVGAKGPGFLAVGHQVPAFGEFLYGIGTDGAFIGLRAHVFAVADAEDGILQHGPHGHGEPFLPGRDILNGHPAAQALFPQREQAVHGEGIDQVIHGLALVHSRFAFLDAVGVGAAVADDGDAENLFDGHSVVQETAPGIGLPVAGFPAALQGLERESGIPGLHEGLHQKDVFTNQFLYHDSQIYEQTERKANYLLTLPD